MEAGGNLQAREHGRARSGGRRRGHAGDGSSRRNSGSEEMVIETTGVSPTRRSRFLPASGVARTRFRGQETVSFFSTLFLG